MFRVNRCGYDFHHEIGFTINRPFGSGDYLFLLFKSPITFVLSEKLVRIENPSILCYNVGTYQHYFAEQFEMISDWIHFNCNDSDAIQKYILLDTPIEIHNFTLISENIKKIQYEYIKQDDFFEDLINSYLNILFLITARETNKIYENLLNQDLIKKMNNLRIEIYNNPKKDWNIEEMRNAIFLSRSYFHKLYSKLFNTTPFYDVINSRINHATYLLENKNCNISTVAEQCGYKNYLHFLKQFKSIMGKTPSEYQKQI